MSTSDTGNATKWAMSSEGRGRGSTALQWKKDVQTQERQSAMADYESARREQVANMARLRELRLERDAALALSKAADAAVAAAAKSAKVAKAAAKATIKATAATSKAKVAAKAAAKAAPAKTKTVKKKARA